MGTVIPDEEPGPLDHFLARYRLYSVPGRQAAVVVEHPPWPLHEARVDELRQDLLEVVGLPAPESGPLRHASPGVAVSIGMPQLVARNPAG